MYKSFHLPSFFHPITQERGVSKRQGRCWAAGQGQPTTGSHGTVVTHPTFSGRRGKCISSAQQSRNLKMISSHFPVSVACGTEWLKPWKIRQLTHLYMLFKKNKTVDNCCAVLCTFYCLPKKTRAAQRCRSSLCPTNQPQHLRFFFSSRAVQRIVFLTGNNIFQKTSQLVSEYWRFWHITIELHGYTSWYLYAFSFIKQTGWPGSLSCNTWWSHFPTIYSSSWEERSIWPETLTLTCNRAYEVPALTFPKDSKCSPVIIFSVFSQLAVIIWKQKLSQISSILFFVKHENFQKSQLSICFNQNLTFNHHLLPILAPPLAKKKSEGKFPKSSLS